MDLIVLGRIESRLGDLERVAKAVPLIVYLTEHGPCSRSSIARMFWPNASKPQAALSTTLWRIRQTVPDAIDADDRWLRSQVGTDVAAFNSAIQTGDLAHAAQIYGGDLLPDVELLDVGAEVQEWLIEHRRFLARLADDCGISLAPTHPELASRVRSLVSQPGKPRPNDPSPMDFNNGSVLALSVDLPSASADANARHVVCSGRDAELTQLAEMCRPGHVVNLTGPTGVGKSALLSGFEVSLGVGSQCISRDLQFGQGADDDYEPLPAQIERSDWVLIDHAPSDLEVDAVMAAARVHDTAVIIASRTPLRAAGVSTFRVGGLRTGVNAWNSEQLSPGAQLLADVAVQSGAESVGSPNDQADLERLAAITGGFPGAIELLGAWLTVFSPSELTAIDHHHDAFRLCAPGSARSLGDFAAQLVDPDTASMTAISRLSLFAEEFDLRSAQRVADVSIDDLLRLRELGLIELHDSGSMKLVGLLRLTGEAILVDHPQRTQAELAYLSLVIDWLESAERSLGEATGSVSEQVDRQLADYERALELMIAHESWEAAAEFIDVFARVLLKLGRASDLRVAMQTVVRSGHQSKPRAQHRRLINTASGHLATAMCYSDEHQETIALCDHALEQLGEDEFETAAILYRAKSIMLADMGRFDDLMATQKLAGEAASRGANERLKALTQWDLAVSYTGRGQLGESNLLLKECLEVCVGLGDRVLESYCYLQLARNVIAADPAQALVYIELAREEIRSIGDYYQLLYLEGEARRYYGEPQAAKNLYLEAKDRASELDSEQFDSVIAVRLATVEMAIGNAAEIGDLLASGLAGLAQTLAWPDILQAMAETALLVLDKDPADELARSAYVFAVTDSRFPGELTPVFAPPPVSEGPSRVVSIESRLDAACEAILRMQRRLAGTG